MPVRAQSEDTCDNARLHGGRDHSTSGKSSLECPIGTDPAPVSKEQHESVVVASCQSKSGMRFWLLIFNLGTVVVLGALDTSIIATAIPHITDDFHTVVDVGWYSVAFRLCQCAFQIQYGKAYKLFSVKRTFLLANFLSTFGSVLCATAVSSHMLVLGRAVAGFGYAGLNTGAMMMLVRSTPLRTRPTYLGVWSALAGLATVAGPLLGGVLTQTIGWRYCFYITPPIGALTFLLTVYCFADPEPSPAVAHLTAKEKWMQLDLFSSLALVPALVCLFLALSWAGNRYPWNSTIVIALLATSGVLGAAFIYYQSRRGDAAALPARIMKDRTVFSSFIFATSLSGAANVLENFLPIYYQAVHGFNPAQSSYVMLAILITATLGAVGSGILTTSCGYYAPFMFLAAITVHIAAGLITTFQVRTSLTKLVIYTGIFGLGYGVGSAGPAIAIQTVLADEDISMGISALQLGSSLGPAITVSIAQQAFTSTLSDNLARLLPHSSSSILRSQGLIEMGRNGSHAQIQGVIDNINMSLKAVWYLVVILACVVFLGCMPLEWRSVKKTRSEHDSEAAQRPCFATLLDRCVDIFRVLQFVVLRRKPRVDRSAR